MAGQKQRLHDYSVQEAAQIEISGVWSEGTAATTGSSANVNNTIHFALNASTNVVGVYTAVEIYFSFTGDAGTDISATNSLVIPKDTTTFLTVPRGLGATIAFNHNSTSTTTGAVRIVEI